MIKLDDLFPSNCVTQDDWSDISRVQSIFSERINALLNEPKAVLDLIDGIPQTPALREKAESDFFFDRLVLLSRENYSVRLHFLKRAPSECPHNHRASFLTRVLYGGYRHFHYGDVDLEIFERYGNGILPAECGRMLNPTNISEVKEGDEYIQHHSGVHSTIVDDEHISLVVRGPSQRRRLLFVDKHASTLRWHYGSSEETENQVSEKRMSDATFYRLRQRMTELASFSS